MQILCMRLGFGVRSNMVPSRYYGNNYGVLGAGRGGEWVGWGGGGREE